MATALFTSTKQTIRYKVDSGRVVEATLLPTLDDSLLFSALVDGEMFTSTQPLQYRALQAACKVAGIKASGKCETLRRNLHVAMAEVSRNGVKPVMPQTKRQRRAAQAEVVASTVVPEVEAELSDETLETMFAMDCADCYECPDCEPEVVATPAAAPAPKQSLPKAAVQAKASKAQVYSGLTYREAQRFCTQARKDGFELPCKCMGWDNLKANIDAIMA